MNPAHVSALILAAQIWLAFALIGIPVLYVGYGFVMSAKRANDLKLSQKKVVVVDACIAVPFVVLDVLLNVFVFSVLSLDFRPRYTFTTITHRLSLYSADPNERLFRKGLADLAAAFLDGKDPSGDHVNGINQPITWLN